LAYPVKWLEEVEKESVLYTLRNGNGSGQSKAREIGEGEKERMALGIISDWTRDLELESRAINSLLILRNASFLSTNAKSICRSGFIDLVARFFSLPVDFLLEMSLRQPEPLQHLFVLIQSTFPYLQQTALGPSLSIAGAGQDLSEKDREGRVRYRNLLQAFSKTLPTMIVETRDAGILHNLLPILIAAFQIPNIPPPPPSLIPYLLNTTTLNPPVPMLELCIDLLISLSQNSVNSRTILSNPSFPAHLRQMIILLEHGVKKTQASWEAPGQVYGVVVPNPASTSGQLEQATKRRRVEREKAQRVLESGNAMGVVVEVGDRPPVMSVLAKRKLQGMSEPARAIHW
jgi:chromatin structure-remodeling complex subunit RSC9